MSITIRFICCVFLVISFVFVSFAQDTASAPSCVPPCRSGYTCVDGKCVGLCNPPCRSGYTCVDGKCIELCNPPCPTREKCDRTGNCVNDQPAGIMNTGSTAKVITSGSPSQNIENQNRPELGHSSGNPLVASNHADHSTVHYDSITRINSHYYLKGKALSSWPDFNTALSSCPAASRLCLSADHERTGGMVFSTVGGVCLGWNLGNLISNNSAIPALWVVGVICTGVGITVGVIADQNLKTAINVYNSRACTEKTSFKCDILFSDNSLSLCCSF